MQDTPLFKHSYSLDKKTVEKAILQMHLSQNKTKITVQTILLVLLLIWFSVSTLTKFEGTTLFLLIATLFALAVILLSPLFEAKRLSEKYQESQEFSVLIFNQRLEIVSSKTTTELELKNIRVIETADYLFLQTQTKLFPILKNSETEKFADFLKEKLENRYKNYSKK